MNPAVNAPIIPAGMNNEVVNDQRKAIEYSSIPSSASLLVSLSLTILDE